MKTTRKASLIFILLSAALIFFSCKPTSYGTFKVIQSKAVKGDYIILPDLVPGDDDQIAVNKDKSYHIPLLYYKAIESRLPDLAAKINDFSTGITSNEANKQYALFSEDHAAGLITDEKTKSAYYAIITDLMTKQDAKNAEATAFLSEFDTFNEMFISVIDVYLEALVDIYDFANKNDTYTINHEELFTEELRYAAMGMDVWFPSVKFIHSFEEKTGPEIANPWIPDWEDLLSKMSELNNDYSSALIAADKDDPDELEEIIEEFSEAYDELYDIWINLPSIDEYEAKYEELDDKFTVIDDKAYDMWEEAYDTAWDAWYDSYWGDYWW